MLAGTVHGALAERNPLRISRLPDPWPPRLAASQGEVGRRRYAYVRISDYAGFLVTTLRGDEDNGEYGDA
jgi:hypothetical protein